MANPRSRRRKLMAEINVVPYIDVMLVLLVIFMVTAPLLQQGVEVELPRAPSKPLEEDVRNNEPLVITVDQLGRLFMNRGEAPNQPMAAGPLADAVEGLLQAEPDLAVYIRGDANVSYQHVVGALVILQEVGAQGVGLITEPPSNQAN